MATVDELFEAAIQSLNQIGSFIQNLVDDVVNGIANFIDFLSDSIGSMITGVVDSIVNIFDNVLNSISGTIESLVSGVQSFISDAVTFIDSMIDQIVSGISDLVSSAIDLFNSIIDETRVAIETLVSEASAFFSELFETISREIQSIVDSVILFFEDIFNTVKEGVALLINAASEVVVSIRQAVEEFITSVVDVIGSSLRDLLETIASLPDAISELAQTLFDSAVENVKEPIVGIPKQLIDDIVETISGAPVKDADKLQIESLNAIFGRSPVVRDPEEMRSIVSKMFPENTILRTIMTTLVSPLILMNVLGGMANANGQILLQEHAVANPYRIMDPPDLVRSVHYGLSTEEVAKDWMRRWGYEQEHADSLFAMGETIPPAGELVSWRLREFITEAQFNLAMKSHGWSDENIERLRQAMFFVPPVQDLITMAVREVFTPEIAQQFGQFEDFPEDFIVNAAKQGVSKEWARNYWAAHWRLPSVQMGFEMLHRDVIDTATLENLLKAADIMPFWRDKLTAISFSPLTRVDVRRMHKLGVLSEEEVNRAYRDIGYDDTNAARLTQFTVELNAEEPEESVEELATLTRSNIVRFFKAGVFTRDEALKVFIETGESIEAAELFLISAELDIEAELREDAIDLVIERVKGGLITLEQAEDELNSLDLQELEKQRAINDLRREQARRNKIPSKGDLDKFLVADLITEDEYLQNIQLLGFSEEWAKRYLLLIRSKQNAG